MINKIKPPLVLTLICIITALLLSLAYETTYVDTTGVLTDELKAACVDALGDGEYTMLAKENEDGTRTPITYNGAASIIEKSTGETAFEIISSGYAKNSIHLVVGIDNNGKVAGVSIISINDTPGLGTKVNDKGFLSKFSGLSGGDEIKVDNVTSATYSSTGVKNAVKTALAAYSSYKEEKKNG